MSAFDEGLAKFEKIDVLVNNAAYGTYGVFEAISMEDIRFNFDANVLGLLAVTKVALPHFRANKSGVIVNISSIGGKVTLPLGTIYHGTKFAVEGISEALHYELEAIGVKMKIVEPGAIKTSFAGRAFEQFANDESMSEYQGLVKTVMGAMGSMAANAAPASLVAEVIWNAATDGTNTLRYAAGEDAKEYIANRQALDDEIFIGGLKKRLGF